MSYYNDIGLNSILGSPGTALTGLGDCSMAAMNAFGQARPSSYLEEVKAREGREAENERFKKLAGLDRVPNTAEEWREIVYGFEKMRIEAEEGREKLKESIAQESLSYRDQLRDELNDWLADAVS